MFLLSVLLVSCGWILETSDEAAIHPKSNSASFTDDEPGESGEGNVPNYSLQYKGRKVYPDVYFYPSQSFLWIRKSPLVKKSINSQTDYLKGGNYDSFKREATHTEECIDDNNKTTFIICFLVILFLAIIIICIVIIFVKRNKCYTITKTCGTSCKKKCVRQQCRVCIKSDRGQCSCKKKKKKCKKKKHK